MRRTRKQVLFASATVLLAAVTATIVAQTAQTPKPKRINRAIELLDQGQPVYYTGSHSGTTGSFEQGVKDAQTYADYISYDMEHAPFDVTGLSEYMNGLVAGGPTRSGHRTPAVIVNVPVNGTDEAVRANAWMFSRCWRPAFTASCSPMRIRRERCAPSSKPCVFRFTNRASGQGISEGRRGVHGAPTAAQIWGVSQEEYFDKADAWPLNPNGELLLGLKLEDKYALANAEENLKVPGIAFAEWGPGDMALSLGVRAHGKVARRIRGCWRRAPKCSPPARPTDFLPERMTANNVIDMLKEGVMIGPASPEAAALGRQYTNRPPPY